ncbi:MAG: AsmA-like C-terminal domain-containing protein [Deltaproteobacteria bacterium]|nr:AsmA-like C-terminal domain-containing protein [Deltaproteobacteria bacterium]
MKTRKKVFILISGGVLILCILGLLAPLLLDSNFIKGRIIAHIGERTGWRVKIKTADISLFPRPHAIFGEASLSIPEKASLKTRSLAVYPRIWPLLAGKLEIALLKADSPQIGVEITQSDRPSGTSSLPFPERGLHNDLIHPLTSFMREIGDVEVQVDNGTLNLSRGKAPAFWFSPVHMLMESSSKGLTIDLTCRSNLWEGLDLKGHLDLTGPGAEGEIGLTKFRPTLLPAVILPRDTFGIGNAEADLNIQFKTGLAGDLEARIEVSIPLLPIRCNKGEVVFKGVNMDGIFGVTATRTTLSVSRLNLDYPRLHLAGQFTVDKTSEELSLRLQGRDIDLPSLREVALSLGGANPTVQDIFAVVRGGEVPLITLETHGKFRDALGDLKNILIRGRISGGEISIPALNMDLREVRGDALISEGILHGSRLQARLGKTLGKSGNLKLALPEKDDRFHLDIVLEADLAQAHRVLEGLMGEGPLKRELGRIDQIDGKTTARLVLGETLSSIRAKVEASRFDLRARYQPIPYHLEVRGGPLTYANGRIKAEGLAGRLGKTTFSRMSGMMDWRDNPYLEIHSAQAHMVLHEIWPWLSSPRLAGDALKEIKDLKGDLLLSKLDFAGSLLRPLEWKFKTECTVRDMILTSPLLPGRVGVREGAFKADQERFILKDARVDMMDAAIDVSGEARGYLEGLNSLKAAFEGTAGVEAVRAVSGLLSLPEGVKLQSPFTISKAKLIWKRGAETSFSGSLSAVEGPEISINVRKAPGTLKIKELTLKDERSDASFSCNIGEDALSLRFSGKLDCTSLDLLLAGNTFPNGWIRGDLWARIIPGSAIESTVQGVLRGRDITVPGLEQEARLEDFSLEAGQQRVTLKSAHLTLGHTQIRTTGTLHLSEQGPLFNLDLSAGDLDLNVIKKALEEGWRKAGGGGKTISCSLPVKGTARVRLNSLTYGEFRWEPLYCTVSSEGDTIRLTITDANLCGISTPGIVDISGQGIRVDFKPRARERDMAPTVACLYRDTRNIDGRFDLESRIRGEGTATELIRSLNGPFKVTARDGRILRDPVVARVLSLLSLTEIFKGRLPDLSAEGIPYNTIIAKGNLEHGKLHVEKLLMDSPAMNLVSNGSVDLIENRLNFKLLASPFTTVDRIIKALPVIGYVLNDKLISIAVKVTGTVENPQVNYMQASEVGKGLLGIVERTLELPVKVVEPMLPAAEKKKE